MRKALLVLSVLLIGLGCQKLNNPLVPDTNLPLGTGAGNFPLVARVEPPNRTELWDDEPGASGIQGTVVVTFSDYMDEAALLASVLVRNTTTGQDVAGLALSYTADARKLYVRHVDWTPNAAYLLIIGSGGAKNRWGVALDGNRNGKADGSPYDDALTTFYTAGSAPGNCVGTVPSAVDAVSPDTERITDTLPTVTVTFTGAMDTTTLIPASFMLVSETGSSVQLNPAGVTPNSVSFTLGAPLLYGRRYDLTILSSGVKGAGLDNTPDYLLKLDADGDGSEASESDFRSYFLCDTVAPPTVSVDGFADRVEFDFSDVMDGTTLVQENIRVFDEDGYVPGSMVTSSNAPGNNTRVTYHFSRPVNGNLKAFVSRATKTSYGTFLDGGRHPNGIGGEPWDDYWWP
jgi:hypothetical protein